LLVLATAGTAIALQGQPAPPRAEAIRIVQIEGGVVEVMPAPATLWIRTQTNQLLRPFDRVRTGRNARAALRWSDRSVVPMDARTEIEILPPHAAGAEPGLHLIQGVLSFFHRDRPGSLRAVTRGAVAGIEGTEFVLRVDQVGEGEQTSLAVFEGRVTFTNALGALILTNGQQAKVMVGQAPVLVAGFIAENVLQWACYYPAVLDLRDLALTADETNLLASSLAAYRRGDLLAALSMLPPTRPSQSDSARLYYAALWLAVGQRAESEAHLDALATNSPSAAAVRVAAALRMLAAVAGGGSVTPAPAPQLSTELLSASYQEQSRAVLDKSLRKALALARQAVRQSPDFGFGWARVAELEFSFGRLREASAALEQSLLLAPRNAQALALKGFLFAAQNRNREALSWFNEAIAADSGLGNAWLGRGLVRIRRGDREGGREDLLIAAAIEPKRSILRSYLSKAWSDAGEATHARKELDLARQLDPGDPTPWLYLALLNGRNNRLNESIGDLQRSQELNDNRRLYQSKLRLDQDRAVSSANLARLYADVGLQNVAVREAGKAVDADYASFSPHLFLANSYAEELRSSGANLRLETPAAVEYLMAALLGPITPATFSPQVAQEWYGPMLEQDGLGLVSRTDYLSRGAWRQTASQYVTLGRSSYSVGIDYDSDNGEWANQDFEREAFALAFKHQISGQGSLFLQYQESRLTGGDLASYYDETNVNPGFRFTERQSPVVLAGYHHEWSPASHTLALFTLARASLRYVDPLQVAPMIERTDHDIEAAFYFSYAGSGSSKTEFNYQGLELQQVLEGTRLRTVVGGRFQWGSFKTAASVTNVASVLTDQFVDTLPLVYDSNPGFNRLAGYLYERWEALPSLFLVGALTLDHLEAPRNFRSVPPAEGHEATTLLLPKVGIVWEATSATTLRGAYTRSLGGVAFDQSLQIEPSSIAGFNQLYRSIIPDSVSGAISSARFETFGLALDQQWHKRTFLNAELSWLRSAANEPLGVVDFNAGNGPSVGRITQQIRYDEPSAEIAFHRLVGDGWSFSSGYRIAFSRWSGKFPQISHDLGTLVDPDNELFEIDPSSIRQALLHQLRFAVQYQHPTGWFGRTQAAWFAQDNSEDDSVLVDDRFVQWHVWLGYRHPGRRFEVMGGVLNLLDQDYRLNPLNPVSAMPRGRTFALNVRFNF